MIRPVAISDAKAIASIYNHYILNTIVTFEEQVVSVADIAKRIRSAESASLPWLVSESSGKLVGYAYASQWHGRSAYRYSTEITIYLDSAVPGQGLGAALYADLFPILRKQQIHTIIGVIALPNEASIALHEKFGLTKVAHFKEVGFKFNQWVDVGYWQALL